MTRSISILLGAGFSAPMGYPTGDSLNKLLMNCQGTEFGFHSDGVLCVNNQKGRPDWGYKTSDDVEFDFCRELIKCYNERFGRFDYEEFYDFLLEAKLKHEQWVDEVAQPFLEPYDTKTSELLRNLVNIYSQMVMFYLVDKEGIGWYDNAPHTGGPIFPGYTGILNCLKVLGENYVVNVHTLNHDLFFERLDKSDWIAGELCDGFEELGSPYYGMLQTENASYKVRLQHYTGKYNKKFRIYKLHGSRDYGLYYGALGSTLYPQNYIKSKPGVGFGDFYKEIQKEDGSYYYENCWVNYHADFLTGTTSKIERYKEPLLFKVLFVHFIENLKAAEKLIIIGYGGKDSEINKMLVEHFNHFNKPTFIIDPFAGEHVEKLRGTLNAKLIKKNLEDIELQDIEIGK